MISLNAFLARLSLRIDPQLDVRNVMIPGMRSPEVFDSFEPEFRRDLNSFFDAHAIDMMDRLAANEYWFIMMAAAALVRARTSPVCAQDVQDGVFLLRGRIWRHQELNAIYGKLRDGFADRMSGQETLLAKQEGMLVWDSSERGGELLRVNPVFFSNTGSL